MHNYFCSRLSSHRSVVAVVVGDMSVLRANKKARGTAPMIPGMAFPHGMFPPQGMMPQMAAMHHMMPPMPPPMGPVMGMMQSQGGTDSEVDCDST